MSNDNVNDDPHWDPFAYHPRRPPPPTPNAHAGPSFANTPQLGRPIIDDDSMEEVSWRMSILELDSATPPMDAQPRQYPVVPMYTMNANGEPEIEYPEFVPMVMDESSATTTPLYPPYVPPPAEETTQQPAILYPPGVQSWPSARRGDGSARPSEGATTAAEGSSSGRRPPRQSFVYVFPSTPSAPPKPLLIPQLVRNTVPDPEQWFDDSYVEQCPPPVAYNRWARKLKNPWWSRVHKPSTLNAINEADEDHSDQPEDFESPQHKRCHSV